MNRDCSAKRRTPKCPNGYWVHIHSRQEVINPIRVPDPLKNQCIRAATPISFIPAFKEKKKVPVNFSHKHSSKHKIFGLGSAFVFVGRKMEIGGRTTIFRPSDDNFSPFSLSLFHKLTTNWF
jgi:hypothetical protein